MSDEDGRIPPDEPDAPYAEYEDDADEEREARTAEAGLSALGGPVFGTLFGAPDDDGGFDAEHNP